MRVTSITAAGFGLESERHAQRSRLTWKTENGARRPGALDRLENERLALPEGLECGYPWVQPMVRASIRERDPERVEWAAPVG